MSILNTIIETQEFATLPTVASKLLKILENEDVDIRDISHIIETDPSLTLKLLKVANSPLYATKVEIKSIQQAIIILGLNRLTNIVLGISIFSKFLLTSQKNAADIMEKFWWHSSCTGTVAKTISNKIGKSFKEFEFIGGLLHDIGKLAMLQHSVDNFYRMIEIVESRGCSDVEAEKEIFDINHLEIGESIAKLWKLPVELSIIISHHNYPATLEKNNELVAIVRMADLLCELWGAGVYEGLKNINIAIEESWKVLCKTYPRLEDLNFEEFKSEVEEDFKKSLQFLNLMIQSTS